MRLGFRFRGLVFVCYLRGWCSSLEIWVGKRGFYAGPVEQQVYPRRRALSRTVKFYG